MYERSVLLLPSRRNESNWQWELATGKEFPPNDFPQMGKRALPLFAGPD
jgi:hypothetical protein